MDIKKLCLIALAFLMTSCKSTQNGTVTNYTTKGNLEYPNPTQCVPAGKISQFQNPAHIFNGINKCLMSGNYRLAAELYFVAIAHGQFDIKRVADKSAHQAIFVIRMNSFATQKQNALDSFQVELNSLNSNNMEVCTSLKLRGKPEYVPTYMIQHGISAFTGLPNGNGLVENFISEEAWHNVLISKMKCS